MKPTLLVLELWGLGDLVIATSFLRAATEKYQVTLLAKPFALELAPRLWPEVRVVPFIATWTAFRAKYHLWQWPWPEMRRLQSRLAAEHFDYAVSARWDPRDHWVLKIIGAAERLGFPRLKSARCLTRELKRPDPLAHRSEFWRVAGRALGLTLPSREATVPPSRPPSSGALLHSGARLPARVWPLDYFRQIAARLRDNNIAVHIACDPNQLSWWRSRGENASCPQTVTELFASIDRAGIFIGNCSGPGHLAAICGLPTFTLYGPSLPEWFAPMHPAAEKFEGKSCPYKPCSDYCRFAKPFCLGDLRVEEVWSRLEEFANRHLST